MRRLIYCAAAATSFVNSAIHNRNQRHTPVIRTMYLKLTVKLNMLLHDSRLNIVIPVPLNPDDIPINGPALQPLDVFPRLVNGREVEELLEAGEVDGGEG